MEKEKIIIVKEYPQQSIKEYQEGEEHIKFISIEDVLAEIREDIKQIKKSVVG